MTSGESPRLSIDRKSLVQVLTVLAFLLLTLFFWRRSRPERIAMPTGGSFKIVGDTFYGLVYRDASLQEGPRVEARSLRGGALHVLVEEDPRYRFYRYDMLSVTAGKLYYAVELRPPGSSNMGGNGTGGGGVPLRFLGTFRAPAVPPPSAAAAGQQRRLIHRSSPSKEAVRFRQVSLPGGTARTVAALQGEGFCLVGDHVFWIRPGLDSETWVIQDRTEWTEVTAHSDLMLTSLSDGTTRCIRAGIPRYSSLTEGETGVIWSEVSPFPEPRKLFYARASDGSVHALGVGTGMNASFVLEFKGRIYWTVSLSTSNRLFSDHVILMSANQDGTDARVVFAKSEKHLVSNLSLYGYRDSLYCCFTELPLVFKDYPRMRLCRLHPDRSEPLEIVRTLPAKANSGRFAGGYLYFGETEKQRSLWASLTDDNTAPERSTSILYRVPLNP